MAGRCGRTWIAIVAIQFVGGKDAVAVLTGFVRAGVSIIAGNGFASDAFAVDTAITDGAGVSVRACSIDWGMATPSVRLAPVHGTWVSIVACEAAYAYTLPRGASIAFGAVIPIVTR